MANWLKIKLATNYTRPVIDVGKHITCLIDTGADTPVWTQGSTPLVKLLSAKKIPGKHFVLSGFGKTPEIVDVYEIPELKLVDESGKDEILFKDMVVACTSRPNMIANLILPATVFSNMNYLIHNVGITVPKIEIEHDKKEFYVKPTYSMVDKRFVDKVYSFASDENDEKGNKTLRAEASE